LQVRLVVSCGLWFNSRCLHHLTSNILAFAGLLSRLAPAAVELGGEKEDRRGAHKGWRLGVLGAIFANFETFNIKIKRFPNGEGSVLRQIERRVLSKVR
jgi:hypothetical protein